MRATSIPGLHKASFTALPIASGDCAEPLSRPSGKASGNVLIISLRTVFKVLELEDPRLNPETTQRTGSVLRSRMLESLHDFWTL